MNKKTQDRISYSEGVKVNIGDYESRDIYYSYSTDVRKDEKPKDAFVRAKKTVQNRLRVGEKKIRQASEKDVDFETMDRLNYYN